MSRQEIENLFRIDKIYSNPGTNNEEGTGLVDQMLQEHSGNGGACIVATHGKHRPEISGRTEIQLISGHDDR